MITAVQAIVLSILKIRPRKNQEIEEKKNGKMDLENKMDEDDYYFA